MARATAAGIRAEIAKGTFRPHTALSNIAISYYQNAANYFAKTIFPVCPVELSSDLYYIFNKEELLSDKWERKPEWGKVDASVLAESTGSYVCKVDQMILGVSHIRQTDLIRRQGPSAKDPRISRVKVMAQNANIHQDVLFANNFFKAGVWGHEETGVDVTNPTSGQFIKFSNGNSNPIVFIDKKKNEMQENTGRMPNRLALGVNVFSALIQHPAILERVKYGGTTANPATVTENVLAQVFGVERVTVQRSIVNKAKTGKDADMQYIGDPNGFLLAYATDTPSVDEPSAGYIFTWDMLGDGNIMPILYYDGEGGTHTGFVEGLMATDMKKTADDLGMYFMNAV
ncbi:MAG: hypothetical protein NC409_12470 [Clostridium sp.]|nr:hypothetical protein [Clostridium sp.]